MDMDDPTVTAWLAAARAVHFASCLLVAGVWAFDRLVVRGQTTRWRRIAIGLLLAATPVVAISGAAWLVLVAADMAGESAADALRGDGVAMVWSHTEFGRAWKLHALAGLGGATAAMVWGFTRRGGAVALLFSALLVGSLAWAGHGGTGPIPTCHRVADAVHLFTAAVWPAGLVPFALLLWTLRRSTDPDQLHLLSALARRFSTASLTAVAVLTFTGIVNSYCLLGSFSALFTTPYGQLLDVKLLLFGGMIALGAINRQRFLPRLLTTATYPARLQFNVLAEVALATGIIAAVALLGLLEPARGATTGGP